MAYKKNFRDKYYISSRLKEQLERIPAYRLTLVEAPSGFGKTTAVREYLAQYVRGQGGIRWYTCFGESPLKSWTGICSLFDGPDGTARNLLELGLPAPETLPGIAALLRQYRCAAPRFLVIDNYQLFTNAVPRDFVHALSACEDENVHVVVVTQPLPPAAFDMGGNARLTVTSRDFLFDEECITNYCRLTGLRIPEREISRIQRTSGGWVAAVRLQLAAHTDTGPFAETGDINALIESAIWNKLPVADKDFLLAVSLLDGFTVRQAAVVGGWPKLTDAAAGLLSSNFFIRYIADKKRYSMHALLREYLLHRLEHRAPEFFAALHYRAGLACREVADYFTAARFFMKAGEYDAVLSLPFTIQYFHDNKEADIIEFFLAFMEECPEETLRKYPLFLILIAHQFLRNGMGPAFQKTADLIRSVINAPHGLSERERARTQGEFAMLMSFPQYNDIGKMSEYHKRAYAYLKTESASPRSIIFHGVMPWTLGTTSVLGLYWNRVGELERALDAMDDCLPLYSALAGGHGAGAQAVMRAEANLMRGNDAAAETFCREAILQADVAGQESIRLCAERVLAETAILRGDGHAFALVCDRIAETAGKSSQSPVIRMGESCLAELHLALGMSDTVPSWLRDVASMRKILYALGRPYGLMLHGHWLLFEKRHAELYGMTDTVMGLARNMNYLLPQVCHLVYLSVARHREGDTAKAAEHLHHAFELALPDGVYLPFARFGAALPLFDTVVKSAFGPGRVAELEAVCKRYVAGTRSVLVGLRGGQSPLTAREREIALLAKERLSAEEIAARLHIAKSTVNTVLKSVYKKLGIHTKSELARQRFL